MVPTSLWPERARVKDAIASQLPLGYRFSNIPLLRRSLTTLSTICEALYTTDPKDGVAVALRAIATELNAIGCAIWESSASPMPSEGLLIYPTAEHFVNCGCVTNVVITEESTVGRALIRGISMESIEPVTSSIGSPSADCEDRVRVLAAPLSFPDATRSVIAVYRQASAPAFSSADLSKLDSLTVFLPAIAEASRTRQQLALMSTVESHLAVDDIRVFRRRLAMVVNELASRLDCIEVSLFLTSGLDHPREFSLHATTWKGEMAKRTYRASVKDGATGWVLARKQPVLLCDLARFWEHREAINAQYPGLKWNDSLGLLDARKSADSRIRKGVPISWLGIPLLLGRKTIGALRVCAVTRAPFHFGNASRSILEPVARMIARGWHGCRLHSRTQREATLFGELTLTFTKLTQGANVHAKNFEREYASRMLTIARLIVRCECNLDVRYYDARTKELFFDVFEGEGWRRGSSAAQHARRSRRFPVPGSSIGARAFSTGQTVAYPDIKRAPTFHPTFPGDTHWLICAPIQLGENIYGVLDARGPAEMDPAEFGAVKRAIEFLAQHLAVFKDLIGWRDQMAVLQTRQATIFEDMGHQIETPIAEAQSRVSRILNVVREGGVPALRDVQAVRGIVRRASRVASKMGFFELIHGEKLPKLEERVDLTPDTLIPALIDAADDAQVVTDPDRRLRYLVLREGFERTLARTKVPVDFDLLQQAVDALLDNARKYSSPGTTVEVFGGLTGNGRFHITVANTGIKLLDTVRCRERGWRGDNVDAISSEGSGIGLWLVDKIMAAHRGELVFDTRSRTEVKLVFPTVGGK